MDTNNHTSETTEPTRTSVSQSDSVVSKSSRRSPQIIARRVISGMSWYGLEISLAVLGLLITSTMISYGIFAMFNHLKGLQGDGSPHFFGEASIWVATTLLVWIPVTVLLYLRTERELKRYPATRERLIHKIMVGCYRVMMILGVIAAIFVALYVAIRIILGIYEDASDGLVRIVLPSLVVAALMSWLARVYSFQARSAKKFVGVFAAIGVVVMTGLFVTGVPRVQEEVRDSRAEHDLQSIQTSIEAYYVDRRELPKSLDQLEDLQKTTKNRIYRYTYTRSGEKRYELCARFAGKTDHESVGYPVDDYTAYAAFSIHPKGEKCYKLSVGYSDSYDDNKKYDDSYDIYEDDSSPYYR